jgi:1,4-dihydroxy-2-naphthoate polyprenyltransferase
MDAQARDELKRVLDQHMTFFVATSNHDKPWITGLYFGEEFVPVAEGSDDLKMVIYCTVLRDTRKLQNLKANPNVSFYIGPLEPTEVIQGTGIMEIVTDPAEAEHAVKVLVAKAPPAQFFIDHVPVWPVVLRPTEIKLANYWEPDKNRRYWLDACTGLAVPPAFPTPPPQPPAQVASDTVASDTEAANQTVTFIAEPTSDVGAGFIPPSSPATEPTPAVGAGFIPPSSPSAAPAPAAPATTSAAPNTTSGPKKVAEFGKGSGLGWVNEEVSGRGFGKQVKLLLKATRAGVLLVMLLPVLFGAALAFAFNHNAFNLWLLLLTIIGAGAAHLGGNTVNDYWDYKSGADTAADRVEGGVGTHSGVLTSGTLTLRQMGVIAAVLFAVALACGIALSLLVGPWVLIFAVAGFLLAYFYVAPPIAYGYIGHGLGEIGVLFSFGVLPVMGSYYVQTGQVGWLPFLTSLPIGLLTTAILFNHSFLQWQADKQVHKNTPVVTLGPERALTVSGLIIAAAYLTIGLNVLLGYLPWYALAALITIPMIIKGLQTARQIKAVPGYGALMATTFQTDVNTGVLLIISLIIAAFVGGSFLHIG